MTRRCVTGTQAEPRSFALIVSARHKGTIWRRKLTGFCPSWRFDRLEEFVKTPASALTQGEFESDSLDDLQSENPPAYQRAETTRKEDAIVLMIENGKIPSSDVANRLRVAFGVGG